MHTRRIRTKLLLSISLQFALLLSLSAQEIGLQLYSLREQFKTDVPGTLALVNKMGITEIEGGDTYGLEEAEFKALLKKYKLKTISTGVDFGQLSGDLQPIIDKARSYGARYVVTFWIPHAGDNFTLEDVKKAAELFNEAGKVFADNGLSFCYHPHGYEFRPYQKGTLFDYLVENTDPRYVNFEMDVFWVKHPGQDPVSLLNKYPGRFKLMHLKDRAIGTEGNQFGRADVEANVVLGTGDVGISDIMRVARKVGVEHFFIEDESSRSVQQIPKSLKFLSSIQY